MKFSKWLPEGAIKTELRNLYHYFDYYHNYVRNKNNHFEYIHDGILLKFYVDPGKFDLNTALRGYGLKSKIEKDSIIIDCGAYLGTFTIYAAKLLENTGKVVAFEPDPVCYLKLLKNIELNQVSNIIVINKGVWSYNTLLKFRNVSGGEGNVLFTNKSSGIKIPAVSIDSELRNIGIDHVDFIKMDIEGAEIEALKGCDEILKSNNVKLAIASYHTVDGKQTYFEVEKFLKKIGYKVETSFQEHLMTYGWK